MRALEEQLVEHGVPDHDGTLRATAKVMLGVAYSSASYDIAFAPAHGRVAVRIRHTDFGLEADIVALHPPSPRAASRDVPPATPWPPWP